MVATSHPYSAFWNGVLFTRGPPLRREHPAVAALVTKGLYRSDDVSPSFATPPLLHPSPPVAVSSEFEAETLGLRNLTQMPLLVRNPAQYAETRSEERSALRGFAPARDSTSLTHVAEPVVRRIDGGIGHSALRGRIGPAGPPIRTATRGDGLPEYGAAPQGFVGRAPAGPLAKPTAAGSDGLSGIGHTPARATTWGDGFAGKRTTQEDFAGHAPVGSVLAHSLNLTATGVAGETAALRGYVGAAPAGPAVAHPKPTQTAAASDVLHFSQGADVEEKQGQKKALQGAGGQESAPFSQESCPSLRNCRLSQVCEAPPARNCRTSDERTHTGAAETKPARELATPATSSGDIAPSVLQTKFRSYADLETQRVTPDVRLPDCAPATQTQIGPEGPASRYCGRLLSDPHRPRPRLHADCEEGDRVHTLSAVVRGVDNAPMIAPLSKDSARFLTRLGVKTCDSCRAMDGQLSRPHADNADAQYVAVRGPDNSPMLVLLSKKSAQRLERFSDNCGEENNVWPQDADDELYPWEGPVEHAYRVGPPQDAQQAQDTVSNDSSGLNETHTFPQSIGRWGRSVTMALDEIASGTGLANLESPAAMTREDLNDALSSVSSNDVEDVELPLQILKKRADSATPTAYQSVDHGDRQMPTRKVSKLTRKAILALISLRDLKKLRVKDFEQPAAIDKTAGGTANFYNLAFVPSRIPKGRRKDAFIGKDLAHARDEIDFYHTLKGLAEHDRVWEKFANRFCLFSPGVLSLSCENAIDPPAERSLLLLENMKSGINKFRFLDIKMGFTTALPGWKGKSHLRAWKNRQIDSRTNTAHEGCRIEGMKNCGQILEGHVNAACEQSKMSILLNEKKLRKFALQNVNLGDCFSMFFDMREDGQELFAHSEKYVHRVLIRLWTELAHCCALLDEISPPQQWLGSSVALGFDISPADASAEVVTVSRLFDWGRSALETLEDHLACSEREQHDRDKYWLEYFHAMQRLCWEMGRYTFHRALCPAWSAVVFEFVTRDSEVRLMGLVEDLTPCTTRRVELCGPSSKRERTGMLRMVVSISCSDEEYAITILGARVARDGRVLSRNPKKPEVVVYCVAFERQHDAQQYFVSAKVHTAKSHLSTLVGRAFSHPSRTFSLTGSKLKGPETFYLATSSLTVRDLNLPDSVSSRWKHFSPDLRYCSGAEYSDLQLTDHIPQGLKKTREKREKPKSL